MGEPVRRISHDLYDVCACGINCIRPHLRVGGTLRQRLKHGGGGGGRLQPDLMRPTPPLPVKTWRARGGCMSPGRGGGWREGGGGGGSGGTAVGGGGVAMVCQWAVQREQNKDQRRSTPFNEACKKKFGAVGTMAPAPLSLKTRGGGSWGGGVAYKDRARPPPPPGGLKCIPTGERASVSAQSANLCTAEHALNVWGSVRVRVCVTGGGGGRGG